MGVGHLNKNTVSKSVLKPEHRGVCQAGHRGLKASRHSRPPDPNVTNGEGPEGCGRAPQMTMRFPGQVGRHLCGPVLVVGAEGILAVGD